MSGNILGFLYQTSFSPAAPLTNVVTNGGPGAHSSGSVKSGARNGLLDGHHRIFGGTGSGPGLGSVAGCTGPETLEEGPFTAS